MYAELQCRTNFSFLEGAAHASELVERAVALEYAALAITDRNSLAGVVRAHAAARDTALKLLIGAEITPVDAPPVLLYAPDVAAYGRLARLITHGRRAAAKGDCILHLADVAAHADGLLAVVSAPYGADQALHQYRDIFRDRCHLAVSLHRGPDDEARLAQRIQLARRARLPLVATNDVHYHVSERRRLHDVLTAVRHGLTVAELGVHRFANGERHLKSPAEMAALFRACPEAIANGLALASRCHFSLAELKYYYPAEVCPPGLTATEYLEQLTWKGAEKRFPHGVPEKVRELLQGELKLIAELQYESYFLTVWDLMEFARSRGILCQGRGSAANSVVCYCLEITAISPEQIDMLFGRFISQERNEAPDIDVDFEHERREEVLQYIYGKYGRDRAGMTAEVISYRLRSAVRDVGKALGWSLDRVDRLAKTVGHYSDEATLRARIREAGLDPRAPEVVVFLELVTELLGFPRHLSQHVGGFVITRGLLSELVPIENAAMPERTVIQWDKNDLDALGILKVDCLSLGMLTAIRKCFTLVEQHHGATWSLASIPEPDPKVYEMICKADTVGVFQIESRAQMAMLPRLKPDCFYDLVIEVAIVRPGPIQGKMVHPYLRRRNGEEPVTYPTPEVQEVLRKTLGVPLFQEQVMKLAMVAAGFTAGEADQLRRAMGAWRRVGVIEQHRQKMRDGMLARGLPVGYADRLFEHISGFGEYGFPESHAASFALLAYASAWLKCHYPAAFTAAILNSQPMGFYAPAQLVRDAREHGIVVQPIDVNHSDYDCTLEADGALRLGLRLVRGLPQAAAVALMAARARHGAFRSLGDCADCTGVGRAVLARLADADAFASLGVPRRTALWQALAASETPSLFAGVALPDDPPPALPPLPLKSAIAVDYNTTGLSLKAHPVSLMRPTLDRLGVTCAAGLEKLADKQPLRVAGVVVVRQRPGSAKGTLFITLEDETGSMNLVVWARTAERYRRVINGAVCLLADGRIERAGDVIHVMADHFEDISHDLDGLSAASHDYH